MGKTSNSAMPKIAAAVVVIAIVVVGIFLLSQQGEGDGDSATTSSSAPVAGLEGLKSVPQNATSCPSAFDSPEVTSAAVADPVMSCEFAEEVRRSYLDQPLRYGLVTVEAREPATGQNQTMKCSGSPVVTCVGGDDVVVYLN
ncbi:MULTISPECIES: serine/threonine protein kinase [unclassified Rhodococcus (in: high G+C Gram-positive bacteria)]|uniref:serine/threonine protein kinase n=1 Tax=Rhodococcus sp. SJ-3 TaxID=3454628 RepID=UPI003F7B2615